MPFKNLKQYFLPITPILGILISLIVSAIPALWLFFRITFLNFFEDFYFVYIFEILALFIGPSILIWILTDTIKTYTLLFRLILKKSIKDIYLSFSNTNENVYFNNDCIIFSDKYLFLKDEIAIIPYQDITEIYINYIEDAEEKIKNMQLCCNTEKKRKIKILNEIKTLNELTKIIDTIKPKNPNIIYDLYIDPRVLK